MEKILGDWDFDSIGEFLEILFYNPVGKDDPRSVAHGLAIARFLQGKTKIKMSDIISLIYSHKHSAPSPKSTRYHERHAPFSPSVFPAEIHHARPSLFTWATNLIANHIHCEIYKLTVKDVNTHLRASTKGQHSEDSINLVTWEALGKFSIASLCEKYRTHAPVSWYLTESMAGPRKGGVVIVRKRRPHPIARSIFSHINAHSYLPAHSRSKLGLLAPLSFHGTATQMGISQWLWVYGTLRRNPISMSNASTVDLGIL